MNLYTQPVSLGAMSSFWKREKLPLEPPRKDVLDKVNTFVKKHDVPCDFNLATTLDVCLTPEFAEFNARSFKEYQEAGGDLSHVKIYEGENASKRTGIKDTSIDKGATLFTHCPALKISKSASVESWWDIETPRGIITAETVVHCTNGFAGHLITQLKPYVTPTRAQALAFVPPRALSGKSMLASTMSLRYSLHNFYSVMQRKADGVIILGASRKSPNLSQATIDGMATSDDTRFNEEIKQDIISNFANGFPACEKGKLNHGEGAQHTWTGILGMTTDSVPFVGSLNGLPGQYVCAGFNGHGMARIFNCAPGVIKIIQGVDWSETGLPECFNVTEERLQRLSQGGIESIW
ncbi:putative fad dependent [Diaporthe ampelina]|uniref:Putative fad dependent n=1 Tax=Diaporthe ampelina TaxID=1214573 RepID=A0A0G2HB42_9PEZI|nr:putative fad dependent [Diaporthe ampelina]